jgi:sugar phosphate isomerase/epimerase
MTSGPWNPESDLAMAAVTLVPHRESIGAAEVRSVIDAAASAGFGSLAIWSMHHDWAAMDGMDPAAYFAYHRDRGLRTPMVEVVTEWTSDEKVVREANLHLLDVAVAAQARTVIAVTLEPTVPGWPEATAGLRHLCDLAADRGLSVSFEFLPWSAVPTIAAAIRLIDSVDRQNLGLVLDTWHWTRQPGGPDPASLRALPGERIHVLQLNDAPSHIVEGQDRLPPGDGTVDLAGLVSILRDMGASPMVVAEVFAPSLLSELGKEGMARRVFEATMEVLRQCSPDSEPQPTRRV